ncbi:MAG: TolC family protein [Acidobacteria bacterium]|nr:TolC family protein [Acidobacteriota bacterium]
MIKLRAVVAISVCSAALGQQPLTIGQTVEQALAHYPSVRASTEQVSAAASAINLARTSYLPRVDFAVQANRATRNNVFGLMLPQSVIPSISGPVLPHDTLGSNVWGSAAGVLVSWEPFDFGLRLANVRVAEAGRRRAETAVVRTKFEVGAAAADAFLTLLAAQQTALAAQAGVERSRVLISVVEALVKGELRPGADLSRNRAELAVAETQVIQAQEAIEIAKASVAQFLDAAPSTITVQPERLLETPPAIELPQNARQNPVALEQTAVIEEIEARRKALERSYFPRFQLQAATYARGTGALPDGRTLGGINGLGPNIHNWGLGMTVTFPALELPALHARSDIESARQRAEQARLDEIVREVNANLQRARAQMEGARRVAQNTPVHLEAARETEKQALARYRAGLGTLVEVAEAQRLVTQAEIDDSLARLNTWRALLRLAAASGDLDPFLQRARQ